MLTPRPTRLFSKGSISEVGDFKIGQGKVNKAVWYGIVGNREIKQVQSRKKSHKKPCEG